MENKELIAALDAAWWAIRNCYHDLMCLHGPENDKAPFLKASYAALMGGHYRESPRENARIVIENIEGDRLRFPLIDAACKRIEAITPH